MEENFKLIIGIDSPRNGPCYRITRLITEADVMEIRMDPQEFIRMKLHQMVDEVTSKDLRVRENPPQSPRPRFEIVEPENPNECHFPPQFSLPPDAGYPNYGKKRRR